jgi:predicted RNA-binding protein associated with RNAse of E/G family
VSVVELHYTRPPGSITVFRQHLVHRTEECIVTLLEHADVRADVTVRGTVALERGAPVVWFTFPDTWHDIGRFHTRTHRFTGFYANVLTPVKFVTPLHWETTDLFLDVWLDDRGVELLDEDELKRALFGGSIDPADAARARAEAAILLEAAAAGTWPPSVCREWTLERARSALAGGGTPGGATV